MKYSLALLFAVLGFGALPTTAKADETVVSVHNEQGYHHRAWHHHRHHREVVVVHHRHHRYHHHAVVTVS